MAIAKPKENICAGILAIDVSVDWLRSLIASDLRSRLVHCVCVLSFQKEQLYCDMQAMEVKTADTLTESLRGVLEVVEQCCRLNGTGPQGIVARDHCRRRGGQRTRL